MRRGRSLGAVGEPVLNPISFELHADRLGERLILTQKFQTFTLRIACPLRNDDSVAGLLGFADTLETNGEHNELGFRV